MYYYYYVLCNRIWITNRFTTWDLLFLGVAISFIDINTTINVISFFLLCIFFSSYYVQLPCCRPCSNYYQTSTTGHVKTLLFNVLLVLLIEALLLVNALSPFCSSCLIVFYIMPKYDGSFFLSLLLGFSLSRFLCTSPVNRSSTVANYAANSLFCHTSMESFDLLD